MTSHGLLQQLQALDKDSPQFYDQLSDFLGGNTYRDVLPNVRESKNLAWFIEFLDSVLVGISDHASHVFQESLHELKEICRVKGILPKSCAISESLLGCVYQGTFDGLKVRVRRIRTCPRENPKRIKETFHQAAVMSKHLAHPNIVPLVGVTIDPLELISRWMPGGDLTTYIKNNGDADRLSLLSDVAEGLNYLHSCNVIHGDLKGSSILVDEAGRARITDIGLAAITQELNSLGDDAPTERGYSARWIAPEILEGRGTYSREADVFSFSGVTIEVFTGAVPFSDMLPREATSAIMNTERPPRPTDQIVTDELWTLIQRCWGQEAHTRPHAFRISSGFGVPAWKRVVELPLASDSQISLITAVFSDLDETEAVRNLCGGDAQSFVEVIDGVLDNLPSWLRRRCLKTLCKICGRQALLPKSVQVSFCYDHADTPLYCGGFAEVWRCQYQGRDVAVKVLKVSMTSNFERITRMFCKEVMTWRTLRHPNVLPFVGVTMGDRRFAMLSDWMANGNINEFIDLHKDVNRWALLIDVTQGLIYMHDEGIIHGDLKGANILIDGNGHACLADFGLVTIISDPAYSKASLTVTNAGTIGWMSPELLKDDHSGPTKYSDCYALGMVILEVLSGKAPFAGCKGVVVMLRVLNGEHPQRPEGELFADGLWETLELCWSPEPEDRPAIEDILQCLGRISVVMTIASVLERVINHSFSQDGLPSLLGKIFSSGESVHWVDRLQGNDAQVLVDVLNEASSSLSLPSDIRTKCLEPLYTICAHYSLFPKSLRIELSGNPTNVARYRGGSADVLKQNHNGRQIALKTLRFSTSTDPRTIIHRFCKEFVLWNALRHPNLLPLIGVIMSETEFTMVSDWMPGGNINRFVRDHQDANRFELLSDVTKGLIYVHDRGMIHGDLKGGNILVDQNRRARLADFGLTILSDSITSGNRCMQGGTVRWMSPELLNPETQNHHTTKHSDCYALGMVIYEVLSLHVPFYQHQDLSIPGKVIRGDRPGKPDGVEGRLFIDDLWEILERCWVPEPRTRPSIEDIFQCLEKISMSWTALSYQIDGVGNNRNALTTQPVSGEGGDEIGSAAHQKIRHPGFPLEVTTPHHTTLTSVLLNEVVKWDGTSLHIMQVLTTIFGADDYLDCIRNLKARGIEPSGYINSLDKAIDSLPDGSDLRMRCTRALRKTCGIYGILPSSYKIPFSLTKPGMRPPASGGFSDVWRVTDQTNNKLAFAVKVLRVYEQDPVETINKKYCKEVIVCKRAKHPNVLSIEGVAPELFEFCMVSPWMENGDILKYVTQHPGADRLELLIGVARGLAYLHKNEVVHGDVKSTNILIDEKGNPRLSDFGLCSITRNIDSVNASTLFCGSTVRYSAPEILDNTRDFKRRKSTNKTDVYSFSMVIVEMATGKIPFPDAPDSKVFSMVPKGKRPQKPRQFDANGITSAVWKVANNCWQEKAKDRPEMDEVLRDLEEIAKSDDKQSPAGFGKKLRGIFD